MYNGYDGDLHTDEQNKDFFQPLTIDHKEKIYHLKDMAALIEVSGTFFF